MIKRYEYKYHLENGSLAKILNLVEAHPAGFRTAYPIRLVNNFYLDTLSYHLFYQNIDGIAKRRKFRYRWYGEFDNENTAQLEIKYKENELGWKELISLNLGDISSRQKLIQHFETTKLTNYFFEPKLYNQYSRYYFISSNEKFRLTVDYNQKFGIPFCYKEPYDIKHDDSSIIVELKFDESEFDFLNEITSYLPFLRTKNSKYSNGIQYLINGSPH